MKNKKLSRKEELYITAIKNLVKIKNFGQLLYLLNTEQITEKQYENRITNDSDFYVITSGKLKNENDIVLITEIIEECDLQRLYNYINISEVSNLFSVETSEFHNFANKYNEEK